MVFKSLNVFGVQIMKSKTSTLQTRIESKVPESVRRQLHSGVGPNLEQTQELTSSLDKGLSTPTTGLKSKSSRQPDSLTQESTDTRPTTGVNERFTGGGAPLNEIIVGRSLTQTVALPSVLGIIKLVTLHTRGGTPHTTTNLRSMSPLLFPHAISYVRTPVLTFGKLFEE